MSVVRQAPCGSQVRLWMDAGTDAPEPRPGQHGTQQTDSLRGPRAGLFSLWVAPRPLELVELVRLSEMAPANVPVDICGHLELLSAQLVDDALRQWQTLFG